MAIVSGSTLLKKVIGQIFMYQHMTDFRLSHLT